MTLTAPGHSQHPYNTLLLKTVPKPQTRLFDAVNLNEIVAKGSFTSRIIRGLRQKAN
jgi:hypothetical protein